jgi:hypothetical protein
VALVAEAVRRVMALLKDPAATALYGPIIAGVFGIVGTLLGVALGLFGERWVRRWGAVQCDMRWLNTRGAGSVDSPGGVEVQERQLELTFFNRKDVPVTVWEMRVEFYKGDKPLDEQERPHVEFVRPSGGRGPGPFELVSLPSYIPVSRKVIVSPGHNEPLRQRAVEEADRIEFVAVIEGAGTINTRLGSWDTLVPQKRRVNTPRTSIHPTII